MLKGGILFKLGRGRGLVKEVSKVTIILAAGRVWVGKWLSGSGVRGKGHPRRREPMINTCYGLRGLIWDHQGGKRRIGAGRCAYRWGK